ncbi:hypothetical protein CYMTET_14072 [Cymbomonas tetramitiformis]|uniref:Uncharacterized protein n=1 Tax=Cymbomonas tetramitiformis TaxID=36881 RepID=A0AAE0GHD5_9CHLO|nr:hypothetical protein CYMTET_14072 [Cymbomonas tetramitiformis]|eukprot:gene15551-18433_t
MAAFAVAPVSTSVRSITGSQVRVQKTARVAPRAAVAVSCSAETSRRQAMGIAAFGALALFPGKARADLVEDLLAKTEANKALNDKKRAATSSANFARSRTVTDGTCAFPNNLVGCENLAELGDVKYLSDDLKLECEGVEDGKICPAKAKGSFPSFLGV